MHESWFGSSTCTTTCTPGFPLGPQRYTSIFVIWTEKYNKLCFTRWIVWALLTPLTSVFTGGALWALTQIGRGQEFYAAWICHQPWCAWNFATGKCFFPFREMSPPFRFEFAVKWSEHELELGMMDYTCGRLGHRTRAPEPGVRRVPQSIMRSWPSEQHTIWVGSLLSDWQWERWVLDSSQATEWEANSWLALALSVRASMHAVRLLA